MKKIIMVCVSMLIGAYATMSAAGHGEDHSHEHGQHYCHLHGHTHGENLDKFKKNAITGHVFEYGSHEVIPFATIYVEE